MGGLQQIPPLTAQGMGNTTEEVEGVQRPGGMEKIRQRKPSKSTKKSSPTSETGAAGTGPA